MRLLIFNIVFLFFSSSLFCQDTVDYKTKGSIIKTDILLPAIALVRKKNVLWFTLSGEKFLTNKKSFQFSASYMNWKENDRYQIQGWQIIPQYKFFVFNKKLHGGFYFGPYLKYIYDNIKEFSLQHYYQNGELISTKKIIDLKIINHYLSVGGLMGYQIIIKKRIAFDLLINAGIKRNVYSEIKETNKNYTKSAYMYGLDYLLLLNAGFCFGNN